MLSTLDQPRTLRVLRGEREIDVTITPGPRPLKWPALPGPPKVGAAAPALGLTPYRGTPPTTLAGGGAPHLLFFWATWCGVCKAALPELDAYERASGTTVVAISDEDPAQLDRFFASHTGPFADLVAIDELRRSFLAYGVSGMPTFVLVAPDGTVRHVKTGYSRAKGLELPGWTPLAHAPDAAPRDPS
jgi:thiol-disulfide isomerase/thioredoxin